MSILLNKSEFNFESANILQKEDKYCAVVHCAYYSCLQLMKHIVLNRLNKTESLILQERDLSHEGSHEYLISNVGKLLKADNNPNAGTFVKEINELKKLRVKADYEEIQIGYDAGRNSIMVSDKSNKILKKYI